ncbi:MAG: 3-phosphoshikimate 1-carboxyvinyltransferase [Candidatus Omnitrophica bacterium]|nr:3-phosphoshikimate 1-carboxyvinyltransferase [Candidatus Omnitrophota bacterium]
MILNLRALKGLYGRIHLPASKSYSIRAFLIAALGGTSRIRHASDCEDALIAIQTAQALGAKISCKGDVYVVKASYPLVIPNPQETFFVGESGTTLRFLLPLLGLFTHKAKVRGKGTLVGRPCRHLCETLRRQGMQIKGTGKQESVPILFKGGSLQGGRLSIDGSLSSQFISALMIALPSLGVDSRLVLSGKKLVSREYVQMTQEILAKSGILVRRLSQREFEIKGAQVFKGLKDFYVPSDYGLAAYWLAACALLPSRVVLQGKFDDHLIQSDGHILDFLDRMGVRLKTTGRSVQIKGPFDLKGGTFSLKDCPDLVPVMSILALFAKGRTKLVGIRHARAKESDRISDLRHELLKIGACVSETPDALMIEPQAAYKSGVLLDSHHDHRLAMAFAVLGLKLGCRVGTIESCRKSYPAFVRDIKKLTPRL